MKSELINTTYLEVNKVKRTRSSKHSAVYLRIAGLLIAMLLISTSLLCLTACGGEPNPEAVVKFSDATFEKCLRIKCGFANRTIHYSDILAISELDLSEMDVIRDISDIAKFKNLQELDLSHNASEDISPLKGLDYLTVLNLRSNNISDITPLRELSLLENLYLAFNNISDISVLRGLTALEILDLSDNRISDISALSGLNELYWLFLSDNNISDITPLKSLSRLDSLDIIDNPVPSEQVAELEDTLPRCLILTEEFSPWW